MVKKAESEVGGVITISKTTDPGEAMKVIFTGDWTHREVLGAERALVRSFKLHMQEIRRSLDKEKANESDDVA